MRMPTLLVLLIAFTLPLEAGVRVVVGDSSPVTGPMTKRQISDLFLKKTTRWSDGRTVIPVDLRVGHKVRAEFSERFHGRDVASVVDYWERMIASMRAMAPLELSSEADVLEYVAKFPAAIGYVGDNGEIPKGIRVIEVVN